jgi:C4-dicarboxylate-specific signal transduction histidine kinase
VDLVSIVERAIEASESALNTAQVRLEWRPPGEPVTIDADGARLVQVIGNLLNNAGSSPHQAATSRCH